VLLQADRPLMVFGIEEAPARATVEQLALFDVQDRLGAIQVPTLIVAGRHDPLVSVTHHERLQAGIPHAELVVLEKSGHGVEHESADGEQYAAAIRRFLGQVSISGRKM
jgi:pimeloyl-ACP methyl ester carboxylesterase